VKEIFVGSSNEGLEQAMQVVDVLSEAWDVKPLLWTECFKVGDITFWGSKTLHAEARTLSSIGLCNGCL
jgi:hypothetical protein